MDLGLQGRKAIVCASTRGLGRGCAEALSAEGATVVVNGRTQEAAEQTAEAIRRATGGTVLAVGGDVSTKEGQAALLAACPDPDILVNNNAGPPRKDFRDLDRTAMLDGVVQNMVTPVELLQAVLDGMVARRFGRIVNITSSSVLMPIAGLDLSSGARAGLTAFLAGICRQVAASNVTINNMLPGKMDTDRLRSGLRWGAGQAGISEEEEADRQRRVIPAGRFGTAEEFGKVCAFLCSEHAGYITGRNFLLDGGLVPTAF
ncbi:SDR family oxidoreductase [Propylenella binzhouense]|uniref:SDR family oxidoreductase n=1 Tax=Propylenella binzhouense TaxID=2555902 RepID=A0A964WTE8_9HYPH|nr:SDR family oxidoreductase [Propylenella binzhouense]MYZ47765.1 SDR family oxidoreductase [Propylenella binzhouense]